MSDHTIIDTSNMTSKTKFTFKNLSGGQKSAIVGGGVALSGALAAAVSYLVGNTPGSKILGQEASPEVEELAIDIEGESISIDESYEANTSDQVDETTESEAYDFTFDTEVQFSDSVHDGMSFEDAFSSARIDVGTGGWFNWQDQSYSTFTKEEWYSMTPEEQDAFLTDVIENSSIDNGEWAESSSPNDHQHISNSVIEDIPEVTLELEEESIIEGNIQEEASLQTETIEEPTIMDNEVEDLSEDIIIVKPVRGADINEDGIVDAIVFDNDGDGNIDLVALDEDHDGTFESFMINEDGDEDLDVFIIDEGGDGIDGSDTTEEISDVVNMEDFVVLSGEEVPEDLSFIDDIFGDEDITSDDDVDIDLGLDDAGL